VRGVSTGVAHARVFCAKSAESSKKKGLKFLLRAKKVQKNAQGSRKKGIDENPLGG
jgi:hypothetical protein